MLTTSQIIGVAILAFALGGVFGMVIAKRILESER